jgi:hypothetical protein
LNEEKVIATPVLKKFKKLKNNKKRRNRKY